MLQIHREITERLNIERKRMLERKHQTDNGWDSSRINKKPGSCKKAHRMQSTINKTTYTHNIILNL